MNKKTIERLNAYVSDESSQWLETAKWRAENKDWLIKSAKVAIKILREIRRQNEMNGMSQKKLAKLLHVSPQYVNRIVKGQENLSLETICKIEKVLQITLIETPGFKEGVTMEFPSLEVIPTANRFQTRDLGVIQIKLNDGLLQYYSDSEERLIS